MLDSGESVQDDTRPAGHRPVRRVLPAVAATGVAQRPAGASVTIDGLRQKKADPSRRASGAFAEEAENVLRPLHGSLRRLLASLPQSINKPIDLQRSLGIDAKLAWQIFKFTNATALLPASGNLPGVSALEKFLDRVAEQGVDADIVAGVSTPLQQFKQFIATRAGGRQVFNSMVAGGSDAAAVNLMHRKASFRSAAHFTGVQTDTSYFCFIYTAAQDRPGQWDLATLVYRMGVQRLRPDAIITLAHVFNNNLPPGADPSGPWFEPIEPNADRSRTNNPIPQFCSYSGDEVVAVERPGHGMRLQLAPGGVGMTEAITFASGVVKRNTTERPLPGQMVPVIIDISTAQQNIVIDVLFDAETAGDPATRVKTFMGYFDNADNTFDRPDDERLAINESVVTAGTGLQALRESGVHRADELVEYACSRLGWDVNRYRVHRCRVAYPIVGSSLSMAFSFPNWNA